MIHGMRLDCLFDRHFRLLLLDELGMPVSGMEFSAPAEPEDICKYMEAMVDELRK